MFSVVQFSCDDTIGVIPECWKIDLTDNMATCYYPPPGKDASKSSSASVKPQTSWPVYKFRLLKEYGNLVLFLFHIIMSEVKPSQTCP